jgi:cobalt-zinc-cadmium efflux system membrane fusion protein
MKTTDALPMLALGAVILALGIGLMVTGHRRAGDLEAASPAPPAGEVWIKPGSPQLANIAVDTVRARRERVVAVLPAQLVLDEDHTVRVTSPVAGRVRALDAAAGDHVQSGQALAHLSSSDAAQAQSDLAKAEAALVQASATLTRAQDLSANHVIALRDLQQAQNDEAQAHAERDRAAQRVQQLGAAGAVGQEFVLRSPLAGEVVDRTVNPGAEVRPDNPQPLFTISALDTLWLTANVYERDLAAVRRGERVSFTTDAAPGRQFSATISYVSDVLSPDTRTALLRAVLPNRDHALKTQVFGQVKVFAPDASNLPVVPSRALLTRGAETIVFVQLAPGRFAERAVTVTDDDGETAAVVRGLRPGELVVTTGSILLLPEAQPVQ